MGRFGSVPSHLLQVRRLGGLFYLGVLFESDVAVAEVGVVAAEVVPAVVAVVASGHDADSDAVAELAAVVPVAEQGQN